MMSCGKTVKALFGICVSSKLRGLSLLSDMVEYYENDVCTLRVRITRELELFAAGLKDERKFIQQAKKIINQQQEEDFDDDMLEDLFDRAKEDEKMWKHFSESIKWEKFSFTSQEEFDQLKQLISDAQKLANKKDRLYMKVFKKIRRKQVKSQKKELF
jgi:thymidylate synthase